MSEIDVVVRFATNREPIFSSRTKSSKIVEFGSNLGPIDGKAIRFGTVTVRIAKQGALPSDWIVAADKTSLMVANEVLTPTVQEKNFRPKLGSTEIFDGLRHCMTQPGERPTIAFVHGFSNGFWDSIERAGMIAAYYTAQDFYPNVFVFSWPSRGPTVGIPTPIVDYAHDRANAERSGDAMARALRILLRYADNLPADAWCNQKIHLLAHSMGVYALRYAVQALLAAPPITPPDVGRDIGPSPQMAAAMAAMPEGPSVIARLRGFFDEVVLAAADEDEDAFGDPKKLRLLPRMAARVSVYHTREDWILSRLSKYSKFNGPRLGTDGPENIATISDKVRAIDVSKAADYFDEMQGHQYYRQFDAVRDDIVAVLRGVRDLDIKNRVPLGPSRFAIKAK